MPILSILSAAAVEYMNGCSLYGTVESTRFLDSSIWRKIIVADPLFSSQAMSLWRAKRKYEANQGLNETADDALLAIAILQNESENFGVYTSDEVRENLKDGCNILQGVRDALENPDKVSSYYLALADHLRITGRKQTAKQFSQDLETATTALAESSEDLQWNSG